MLFLPLIERELGVQARRRGSYWVRFGVAGAGILICLPQLLSSDTSFTTNSVGATVFNSLVVIAFILCCAACLLTSDVIGVEKREGTLGLLFLTRLKWFDVILGKLASNGVVSLAALLTLLPLLMIPVLAGGVTGGEAFRKGLALLNTLFLALTVGVYSSACMPERFKAARRAAGWLILLVFFPAFLHVFLEHAIPTPHIGLFSPLIGVISAGASEYAASPASYCMGLIILQAVGWAFLFRAGVKLRNLVRDDGPQAEVPAVSPVPLPAPLKISPDLVLTQHPVRTRWNSVRHRLTPVEWLLRRQRGLGAILWLGALTGIFYSLAFRVFIARSAFGMTGVLWIIGNWIPQVLVGGLSAVFFAWAASRFFIEARRNGELELLLTTPLGASTIMWDQWKLLKRALFWPVLLTSICLLLPLVSLILGSGFSSRSEWILRQSVFGLFTVLNVVAGIVALCWTGLWFGMKAAGQGSAILWTVAIVKVVPYFISFVWTLVLSFAGGPVRATTPFFLLTFVPALATFIFYLWIIRASRRGVLRELSGDETALFDFRRSLSSARRDAATTLARARGWRTT